jgi:protein-L-isoaspartate(D-aspartate) O-methyltransferase
MLVEEDIESLKQQLVDEISHSVQDQFILNAFRRIPRHEFVWDFFDWDKETREWKRVDPNGPRWIEQIYTNRPLVTSLNQYKKPDVSSSQPDIMAKMIQSLHLQAGKRVLEIGTGTGYNAAILACLVNPENVVTIDINENLLEAVRERLERTVGSGVTVLHTDGRNLAEDLANFDAIIVTASHQNIEPSWIRALVSGGRLIVNWNKSFSKAFVELEKSGESGLIGNVARYSGDFMSLHSGEGVPIPAFPAWDRQAPLLESRDFRDEIVRNFDFGFFLQIHFPTLSLYRYHKKSVDAYYYAVKDYSGRVVYFSPYVGGDASLWEEIRQCHEKFIGLGKPRRKSLSLKVAADGTMTFFSEGSQIALVNRY